MKHAIGRFVWGLALLCLSVTACTTSEQEVPPTSRPEHQEETNWPQFRGPHASGVAEGYPTPVHWDVEKGTNILWKTPIPGLAHSSPIIWGDRIFLTTAVRKDEGEAVLRVGRYGSVRSVQDQSPHEFQVLCLDRISGRVLWTRTAWEGVPKIKRHPKGSYAASTPATDGKHVVAFFGTEGLYVYDFSGELLWKKDFGVLDSGFFRSRSAQWGFASSPVIHEGRIYVQCDVQENSFVAALEVASGNVVWRTPRNEVPTWSTPTVDVSNRRRQLILNGYKHIGGYDLDTGEELWKLEGGGDIPVPTPVVSKGTVFITSAHGRMSPILAISTAATGEVTMDAEECQHMLWSYRRGGNYMQTPVVYGEELYCCRDGGQLSCIDAKTGERHYRKRLGDGASGFTASGVAADGKLYFASEEGEVQVIQADTEFQLLAQNSLGETCMASPAICAGTLFFRTRSHLLAIARTE